MKLTFLLLTISSLAFTQTIIIKDTKIAEKVIRASGHSGSDGSDGYDGSDGSCSYDKETCEWSSDDGSDGGDGQDGYNGSDGDNVVIHYSDISELKDFLIYSYGGSGGDGGKGGYGGSGCHGGSDGSDGTDGSDGYSGSKGSLYVVKAPHIYTANNTKEYTTIDDLSNEPKEMIKNFWIKKEGAHGIVNKDSKIQSTYNEFEKVEKRNVQLIWDTNKKQEDYLDIAMTINFDGAEVTTRFDNAFVDYEITINNTDALITIKNIYKRDELLSFDNFKISGQRQNLKLDFKAISPDLKIENITFKAEVFKKMFLSRNYKSVFYSSNVREFITINDKMITLAVGELNFKNRLKKRKKKLEVNITMKITLYNKTLERTFTVAHKIGTLHTELRN